MRWWREQRGSQIVEFAFVAPILIFLVLCVPILGMTVRAWIVVEGAAREGARDLAINGNISQARQKAYGEVVTFAMLPVTDGSGNTLFTLSDVTAGFVGNCAQVTVTYRQPTFVPYLADLLGGGTNLGQFFDVTGSACFFREPR